MPKLMKVNNGNQPFSFMIWHLKEGISYFLYKNKLSNEEIIQFYGNSHANILKWLCSRFVVKELSENDVYILKDDHGKPYIKESSNFISLSHSNDHFASIISTSSVGIDIEKISSKAQKIQSKFCSNSDIQFIKGGEDLDFFFTRLWTIKEAVYKAYGKKSLIFKDQIILISNNECVVYPDKTESINYFVDTFTINDYIFSIALQKN
jgi:4'-phosphopantetheinyl transferase